MVHDIWLADKRFRDNTVHQQMVLADNVTAVVAILLDWWNCFIGHSASRLMKKSWCKTVRRNWIDELFYNANGSWLRETNHSVSRS